MPYRNRPPKHAPRKRRVPKEPCHYEFTYEGDSQPITLDARSLTLPSMAILSLVFAFIYGTYIIVGERNRLDVRINNVLTSVERLTSAVTVLAEQINEDARDKRRIPKTTIEGLRNLEDQTKRERLDQERVN